MMTSRDGFRIHFSEPSMARWGAPILGLTLVGAFLLIVYWPGFNGQWYLDDASNIHQNPNIHAQALTWDQLAPAVFGRNQGRTQIDRPVAYLSLAVNYAIGGIDPFGYHIVNFLIHFLTAAAVYLLARATLTLPRMAGRYGQDAHAIALLAALLWAAHPIQVTAVTYIVQRMAAMAALFSLAAMVFYIEGRLSENLYKKPIWFGLCAVSGLLAVGSKQNAVMLPVSILLYDLVFLADPRRLRRIGALVWLAVAAAIIGAIAAYYVGMDYLTVGYANRPFTLGERLMTQPRVLLFYLWQLVYPVSARFTLLHDVTISQGPWSPWTTLPAMALLAVLAALAVAGRRKAPLLCFAWLFFLVNHIVESTVLPLEMVFEHRNYLPSVFLFIGAGAGVSSAMAFFRESRTLRWLIVASITIIVAAMGHTTYLRNTLFENEIAFWEDNVAKAPGGLHRPFQNLAFAYLRDQQWAMAGAAALRATEGKALADVNQKHLTYLNLANVYLKAGNEDEAFSAYRKVLTLMPIHPVALNGIAEILLLRGNISAALRYNRLASQVIPGVPETQAVYSLILLHQGNPETAFQEAFKGWKSWKNDSRYYVLMGEACLRMGKTSSAAYFFQQSMLSGHRPVDSLLGLIGTDSENGVDPSKIRLLVAQLFEENPEKSIGRLLAAYQHRYYIDTTQIQRIALVIANACSPDIAVNR